MLQAAGLDGLSFYPFSLPQNALTASDVDVGRREVVEALVVAPVIIVRHERVDLRLKITSCFRSSIQQAHKKPLISWMAIAPH